MEAPFGTILVAVGPGGVPGDVRAVSVSALARKSGGSERQVETSLRVGGYVLMPQEAFTDALDGLEQSALVGALSLPVCAGRLPAGTGRSTP